MRGVSTTAIAVVAVVIIAVGGGAFYLLTQSGNPSPTTSAGPTTSTTTSSTAGGNPADVRAAFDTHLSKIDARNIPAVVTDYAQGADVVWTGEAAGLQGNYPGIGNIQLLYSGALSGASNVAIQVINYSQPLNSSSKVQVKSAIHLTGNSSALGALDGTIQTQLVYQYTSGAWKITNETWNYVKFNVQFAAGATTFPEWQRIGPVIATHRGPDFLHNFAWDFGGPASAILVVLYAAVVAAFLLVGLTRKADRRET